MAPKTPSETSPQDDTLDRACQSAAEKKPLYLRMMKKDPKKAKMALSVLLEEALKQILKVLLNDLVVKRVENKLTEMAEKVPKFG